MSRRLITSLVSILFLAAVPAFATEEMDDGGLDRMTAAGEPVVISSAGGTSSIVNYVDTAAYNLTLPANAQRGLQALTIQNVVGEAQLLVNLNVLSASSNVAGTNQQNFSLQSWGSTMPIVGTGLTVDGVAAAAATCGVAGSCSGGGAGTGGNGSTGGTGGSQTGAATNTSNGSSTQNNPITQTAGSVNAAPGGSANAGSSFVAGISGNAAAASSPGVISPTTSASGDLIVNSSSDKNGSSTVNVVSTPTYTLNFASQAQTDLSALFITNVVGSAQVAANLNIAAATLNLIPSNNSQPFATPINTTSAVIEQVNVGYQFRGTPIIGSTGTSGALNISGH
jgi:hypothetical protein